MLLIDPPYPAELIRDRFFVLEGIDGAGKSTQAARLAEYLRGYNFTVNLFREPSGLPSGKKIREGIQKSGNPISNKELHQLFLQDRREDIRENILPALDRGEIVVLDRYMYSNAAYQGLDIPWQNIVQENLLEKFPMPAFTFLLEIPVDPALGRLGARNQFPERFENRSNLAEVAENYHEIAHWDPQVVVIDGSLKVEEITRVIGEKVLASLQKPSLI